MAGEGGTLTKEVEVEAEEEDLDKLETELYQMVAIILESRATFLYLLSSTMSSILASRRPSAAVLNLGPSDQGKREWEERAVEEKARLVKEKMGRKASEMRVVVERLTEYAARTEKMRSSSSSACNGINNIHPAFKKRKIFI